MIRAVREALGLSGVGIVGAPVGIAPPFDPPSRFREIGSAIADVAGRAVVQLHGPPRRERWDLEAAAIDSDAGTASVFRGTENAGNLITIAPATPNALDRNQDVPIYPGERVLVIFAGAGVGTTCTARIEGRRVALG